MHDQTEAEVWIVNVTDPCTLRNVNSMTSWGDGNSVFRFILQFIWPKARKGVALRELSKVIIIIMLIIILLLLWGVVAQW